MIAALTIGAIAGFTLPHLLRLRNMSPVTASVIWTRSSRSISSAMPTAARWRAGETETRWRRR